MSQYGRQRDDDYDDGPKRYHSVRERPGRPGEPDYVREETYIERGKGAGPRDLVFRGRDESVEDIPRDFPPPGRNVRRDYDDYGPPRRAKSARGGRYDDDYDDDRSTVYGTGAAGRRGGGRDRRHRDDRDDESYYSESPPPRRERKKSGIQETLEGLGLGGIVGAALGKKDKGRDRSRSSSRGGRSMRSGRSRSRVSRRRYSDDDSTNRERGGTERKWAQAAQAAVVAGAIEAFRARKEPGPWTGDKGKRIATAAFGAGGIDGFLQGKKPEEKSKIHLAEAVVGGLAINRLANGARSKSRDGGRDARGYSPESGGFRARSRSVIDRFRGRSASRGPGARSENGDGAGGGALKGLVGGAAVAAAGKAIYDRVRSKSRKRRSPSRDSSADSYVPSRNRRRDRRRSPPPDTDDRSTRRSQADTARGQGRDRGIDGRDAAAAGAAGAGAGALVAGNRNQGVGSVRGGSQQGGSQRGGGNGTKIGNEENKSESSSTTDMENKRKRMRGKEFVTAGLATIATIHAAHGVYSSMEAHEKRHRLVAEGEMSPEEARKKQTKAWVQDAAAVGIAALGIKGAFSEWKEMTEQRREIHEIETRKKERRKRVEQRKRQEEKQRQEQMMDMWSKNPMVAMQMHTMQQSMQGNGIGMGMPMAQGGIQGSGNGSGGGGQGGGQRGQTGTYWQRLYGRKE
ncbi:hypothetical protein LTR62_002018 [Meristemomyces frigidus]|uniref:Uncharacterized protein n=1 Tax=Meristemomyces frigidus TaxID=1508187 RepID=A0AAN7TGA0_9PEZI|nr:hypothetical protein LTR62_002018 [Meristemomyces frigidus]